ncbi:beta-L-arabinofuranosidase domain-containing protein [Armatimonas sp.]|uniref:beta-L-arabinofuranosidase domain-containing protein n=1 Tax=Armatimonas sp. TaxID=1872638 RepID=UPI00286B5A57|nr:beta-L-arabinofuranosidase domain-containing protein [Armatimonas sp.]
MIKDVFEPLAPSQVKLTGWLGKRVVVNEATRLLNVDLVPLLAGYKQRPGSHPWIGEHIGKWLHAATLAWQNTGDEKLKEKLAGAVKELIACQEADGYLGTYVKGQRFGLYKGADWDVWSHKYCLIGLLTWWEYTKDAAALACCQRMGDLLCATFGTEPGQKSLLSAGTHVGMAATSVLEPMVLLARASKSKKYLDFCRYIVEVAWEEPRGPKVLSTLTATGKVNKTANGKAYEMLSNLVGLCELYRETGEKRYLVGPQKAWDDIVANQLYLTGSMSYGEHFHDDHALPNAPRNNIGETCVTVTWLQLSWQLLRLTGQGKYAHEIERSQYNHLAAAQRPDGAQWCYYTALEGTKPYGPGINCCVSSGPRGMALAPQSVCFTGRNTRELIITTVDSFEATVTLNGVVVRVSQKSPFPKPGELVLTLEPERPVAFAIAIRLPQWGSFKTRTGTILRGAFTSLSVRSQTWKKGDTVTLAMSVTPKTIEGTFTNAGRTAKTLGPFVLASQNGQDVLFAEAGANGEKYQIWSPLPAGAGGLEEDRSRSGNVEGSICDGDPKSLVVTFDGSKPPLYWFSLSFATPKTATKITYCHGRSFHDGGWFDASETKPWIEVQRTKEGPWEKLGELASYPATTATNPQGLREGQAFVLSLAVPVTLVGLRVVGKPACGDSPQQAFSSCGELAAS